MSLAASAASAAGGGDSPRVRAEPAVDAADLQLGGADRGGGGGSKKRSAGGSNGIRFDPLQNDSPPSRTKRLSPQPTEDGASSAIRIGDSAGSRTAATDASASGMGSGEVEMDLAPAHVPQPPQPLCCPQLCTASCMESNACKILVTGAGFMSDAYDLFIFNLVVVILQFDRPDLFAATPGVKGIIASAVLIGSVCGQLVFGAIADRIGRRKGFITTLALVTVGALLSATSSDTGAMPLTAWLCFWRALMGFGIGGEYPLSATVSSENARTAKRRGRDVASVFSMQGVGLMLAPLMTLLFLKAVGPTGSLGTVWRLALGFGAVPGLAIFYFRYRMHETPHFQRQQQERRAARARAQQLRLQHLQSSGSTTGSGVPRLVSNDSDSDLAGAVIAADGSPIVSRDHSPTASRNDGASDALTADAAAAQHAHAEGGWKAHALDTVRTMRQWWRELIGAAGAWFIFDVVFYSNGLFSATILSGHSKPDPNDAAAVHAHLVSTTSDTLYLALLALPGYWAGVLLIDRLGRRRLILAGWAMMIVTYCVMGVLLPLLESHLGLFYFLYGLSFFWCNLGPNVVTFVAPSELFPTKIRATAHGFSAACGKLGAVLGGALMPVLLDAYGLDTVLYFSAGVSAAGAALTYAFLPETKGRDLDGPGAGHYAIELQPHTAAAAASVAVGAGAGAGDADAADVDRTSALPPDAPVATAPAPAPLLSLSQP